MDDTLQLDVRIACSEVLADERGHRNCALSLFVAVQFDTCVRRATCLEDPRKRSTTNLWSCARVSVIIRGAALERSVSRMQTHKDRSNYTARKVRVHLWKRSGERTSLHRGHRYFSRSVSSVRGSISVSIAHSTHLGLRYFFVETECIRKHKVSVTTETIIFCSVRRLMKLQQSG